MKEQANFNQNNFLSKLNLLARCAKINLDEVLNLENKTMKEIELELKQTILENHTYNIYFSKSENAWRTYIPDITCKNKRRPLKRSKKENLEKEIIRFYIEQQKLNDITNISLQHLYEEWLIYRRDELGTNPKTIYENTMDWNKFFSNTSLSKMPVVEIKAIVLLKFFRDLTKDRTYSHKRISNARSVLNGIFSYAIEKEIIEHNPLSDVNFKSFKYKPVENQSNNVYSKEDTQTLLSYLSTIDEPYSLAIQLSFHLFIRIGETKSIQIKDIDLVNDTIYLHSQALTERVLNDDLTFSSRTVNIVNHIKGTTDKGYRIQYLTPQAKEIVMKALKLNPNGTFLFEPNGHLMTTDRFNRKLKKYCEECNVTYHSSHKIRFYNASTAYNGKNLATISSLMGHSRIETTIHYLRNVNTEDDKRKAFEELGLK